MEIRSSRPFNAIPATVFLTCVYQTCYVKCIVNISFIFSFIFPFFNHCKFFRFVANTYILSFRSRISKMLVKTLHGNENSMFNSSP